MHNTTSASKSLLRYPEVAFSIKFIALMALLYYFNIFYIAITDSNGQFYSSFLHDYLDYISWLRTSILLVSDFIVKGFGVEAYISDIYTLTVFNGPGVIIGYTCLGYGVMSFWAAFIMAQDDNWKKKVLWCLVGIMGIWLINCWRVAILLIALARNWEVNRYMDHHDMFNIVAYVLIFALIYAYYKGSKPALKPSSKK